MSNFFVNNCLFNEWNVIEKNFDINNMPLSSKVFETSNGYIKMIGDFEEEVYFNNKVYPQGTTINGFYELDSDSYGIKDPLKNKNINVIEAKCLKIYVEDEEFNIINGVFLEYERNLDLRSGILYRHFIWESPRGRRIEVNVKRIVSFNNKHLAAICYEVVPLNFSGEIKIISSVKVEKDLKMVEKKSKDSFGLMVGETNNTKFKVICGVENSVSYEGRYDFENIEKDEKIEFIYDFQAIVNKKIQLNKFILYFTSKDFKEKDMESKLEDELINIKRLGFFSIEKSQKNFLKRFWENFYINTNANKTIENMVRFNEFKLLQKYGGNYIATYRLV
ncbi:glycoside hydrolase family 65 protein [Clostridium brassicae]|uniref:Glycoside hydrolase family 65 N-terminal domain-containing protein n=1 Tax=Clostridium brassicae TaxID=2999072 RepID=A0ABT4D7A2_9CLOT|nr:hypothetical protein [Clostridium brassicae]MCY6957126.1 hypothetical protein [Clostridium brassicae]